MTTYDAIKKQAIHELEKEKFLEDVKREKEVIRARRNRSFWSKIFPWKLTIERR